MDYLERNRLLIAEIGRSLSLKRGNVVGRNYPIFWEPTTVTALGHYYSHELGAELFVGLKEYGGRQPTRLRERVVHDLAFIRGVKKHFPQLLPEFPVFHGLLTDGSETPLGAITEDFSQDGRYRVESVFDPTVFPKELEQLVGDQSGDKYQEAMKLCFRVNGKRRLGDFNTILTSATREMRQGFPFKDIAEEMERYTLRIDYTL